MDTRLLLTICLAFPPLASACGAEEEGDADSGSDPDGGDADTDADADTDTDTDTDTGGMSCPEAEALEDCPFDSHSFEELVTAEEIGAGASFVTADRGAILAMLETEAGIEPAVVAVGDDLCPLGDWALARFPDGEGAGLAALDVAACLRRGTMSGVECDAAGFRERFGHPAIALVRGPDGDALFGSTAEPDAAGALEDAGLGRPWEGQMRGLLAAGEWLCVYGDGIYCHDGTDWSLEVEPGGEIWLDMDGCDDCLVAAGAAGALIRHSPEGEWQPLEAGTAEDLTAVGGSCSGFTLGSSAGTVHDGGLHCPLGDGAIAGISGPSAWSDLPEAPASDTWWADAAGGVYLWNVFMGEVGVCRAGTVAGPVLAVEHVVTRSDDGDPDLLGPYAVVVTPQAIHGLATLIISRPSGATGRQFRRKGPGVGIVIP